MHARTALGILQGLNTPARSLDTADRPETKAALAPQTQAPLGELRVEPLSSQPARENWDAPLPLSGEAFVQWENRAAEHVLKQLRHTHDACSDAFAHAAMQLAELGWPALAAGALLDRLESHPADTLCWGALGKVMILAGCPDEAIVVAEVARDRHRLEPIVATNIIVKAMLMKGCHALAYKTVHAQRRRSSLLHSMVKHAAGIPHSNIPAPRPSDISWAKEVSDFLAWRGFAAEVVQWLRAAIERRDFIEVERLVRSPFLAPVRDHPQLRDEIIGLGLDPAKLVAYRIDSRNLPGAKQPSPAASIGVEKVHWPSAKN